MNRYRLLSIILFMGLIYGNEFQILSGDIIQLDDVTRDYWISKHCVDGVLARSDSKPKDSK